MFLCFLSFFFRCVLLILFPYIFFNCFRNFFLSDHCFQCTKQSIAQKNVSRPQKFTKTQKNQTHGQLTKTKKKMIEKIALYLPTFETPMKTCIENMGTAAVPCIKTIEINDNEQCKKIIKIIKKKHISKCKQQNKYKHNNKQSYFQIIQP